MKLAFLESVCYDGPNEKLNIVRQEADGKQGFCPTEGVTLSGAAAGQRDRRWIALWRHLNGSEAEGARGVYHRISQAKGQSFFISVALLARCI